MNINATLIGQMITFGLLVLFTMNYVWPPLTKAMQERQRRIADGLASAERGVREQELAQARAAELLREAKQQAAEIIAQAQQRSNEMVEESKNQARQEGARQLAAAKAEIEREASTVREQLRAKVVDLAMVGATRILKHEVNASVHAKMLEELSAQI